MACSVLRYLQYSYCTTHIQYTTFRTLAMANSGAHKLPLRVAIVLPTIQLLDLLTPVLPHSP